MVDRWVALCCQEQSCRGFFGEAPTDRFASKMGLPYAWRFMNHVDRGGDRLAKRILLGSVQVTKRVILQPKFRFFHLATVF